MESILVFASANENKVREVEKKLGGSIPLMGLKEIGCYDDIPETADTLEGNARMKARFIWEKYGRNCFADDTGLEVSALDNAPGVYSARYAGPERDSNRNIDKLLRELLPHSDRSARFRTVICLILDGQEYVFEGIVSGKIIDERKGDEGFGYDPVFVPDGGERTFAQMNLDEKNVISHRGLALAKLSVFLRGKIG